MDVLESKTRIYSLSTGPTLPEWLGERARRNLSKRDSAVRRRIELLQDFSMPCASSRLRQSHDGRCILAAGTYHPRIRLYELEELGMKFETYLDSEVVDMAFLGSDWGKVAMLLDNRTVQFRAPYGLHTTMRIPTFGRGMAYEPTTCELLVACSGKGRSTTTDGTGNQFVGAGGGEVYRINLEEGRFSAPLVYSATASSSSSSSSKSASVVGGSCISISPAHPLTALGCEDGLVRFWDNRIPETASGKPDSVNLNPFLNLDVKSSTAGYGFYDDSNLATRNPGEVRSVAFDAAGLNMAAGTAGGVVALYDMRTSKPLHVKEHQYGLPIHTVRFHSGSSTVLSADAKLVKIWRSKPSAANAPTLLSEDDGPSGSLSAMGGGASADDGDAGGSSGGGVGSIVSNIEGTADFTHFIVAGDEADPTGDASGLVLCAGEQPKMQSFYVPALGPAPRWCSFLDNITEELEERDRADTGTKSGGAAAGPAGAGPVDGIYEDYKFLTRDEIESMGMQNLVGTPLLRGYMHGFFVDVGLYNRIKAVANPFEYEEYRKKKIKEKMEAKRASRIAPRKSAKDKTAVNPELASRLQSKVAEGKNTKSTKLAKTIMSDDRFGSLFNNPDFQIDEEDINFKLRNPSGVADSKRDVDDDMDSDRDEDESDGEDGGAAAFEDTYDDDEVVTGFKRASDDEGANAYGDDGSESDAGRWSSSDDDDDEIRGENYEEVKALERASKKKKKSKKVAEKKKTGARSKDKKAKVKKNIMFEADDYGGSAGDALGLGLGDTSATSKAKRRREEISLPLEQRLQKQRDEAKYMGETKVMKVKGEGSSKEVSYVPRDIRKKLEAEEARKAAAAEERRDSSNKRKRRNVKDLGFKTPFKNKM